MTGVMLKMSLAEICMESRFANETIIYYLINCRMEEALQDIGVKVKPKSESVIDPDHTCTCLVSAQIQNISPTHDDHLIIYL